jgi:DNA-directed RNA polymerase subunit L
MASIIDSDDNYLEVEIIKSKNINEAYVNTIRRIILSELKSYAFHTDDINISKNTSIFNNDILRSRICLLPIQSIKENNSVTISVSLNKTNTSNVIQDVTTDDCIVKVNNVIRKDMFPPEIIICRLKSEQQIDFSATSSFEKSSNHAMYTVGNTYYDENDKSYILSIESLGQYTCKEIFNNSCDIYLEKILELQVLLNKHEDIDNNHINLKIENENHTIVCVFIQEIQKQKETEFASYKMEHLSINNVIIEIKVNENVSIKKVIDRVINNLHKIFTDLKLK